MKISQYMQYLKKLHHKYGDDVEVKVDISYEDISGEHHSEQADAIKPKYDKNTKCIIVHYELVSNN